MRCKREAQMRVWSLGNGNAGMKSWKRCNPGSGNAAYGRRKSFVATIKISLSVCACLFRGCLKIKNKSAPPWSRQELDWKGLSSHMRHKTLISSYSLSKALGLTDYQRHRRRTISITGWPLIAVPVLSLLKCSLCNIYVNMHCVLKASIIHL